MIHSIQQFVPKCNRRLLQRQYIAQLIFLTALTHSHALAQAESPVESIPASRPSITDARRGAPSYITIPLKGTFGDEITARGVRDAMFKAKRRGIRHVVFVIDSGGGNDAEGMLIARVLKELDSDFTYHAVIVNGAFSACVWVLSMCDHVWFAGASPTGAAVLLVHGTDGGVSAVDAKKDAANVARVCAAAESKGQNPDIYRAMMLQDACLYGWTHSGKYHISGSRPGSEIPSDAVEVLDSETSVLALTPAQAEKWGYGRLVPSGDIGAIGSAMGVDCWVSLPSVGTAELIAAAKSIRKAEAECDRILATFEETWNSIPEAAKSATRALSAARASDPGPGPGTSLGLSPAAHDQKKRYRARIDASISKWNTARDSLRAFAQTESSLGVLWERYQRVQERVWKLRMYDTFQKFEPQAMPEYTSPLDGDSLWQEADRHIADLQHRRAQT